MPFQVQMELGIHIHGRAAEIAIEFPLVHLEKDPGQHVVRPALQFPGQKSPAVNLPGREMGDEFQVVNG
jgi:hypothetical protein